MASRLRGKTSPTPEENERPADSWRPLAQFREVIESEDLVGQTPQNILIPAPALLTVERLDLAAPGNMGPRTGVLAPVVLAPVVLGHGSTSTFWPEPLRPSGWVATPASSAAEARVSTVGEFRATRRRGGAD